MRNIKMRLRRKAVNKSVPSKDTINTYIQSSKEVPLVNNPGQASADRIDAHDLFSHYTADIIKENTVFFR